MISGVVIDGVSHRPLEGAVVTLTPGASQVTNAEGRFVFQNLTARTYRVFAEKLGYIDGSYGGESRDDARGITLAADQWFSDAKIGLFHAAAISGTVLDEHGEPVVGAYVRALARVMVAGEPQFADAPFARSDDRGQYRIWNLSAATYAVTVLSVQQTWPTESGTARALGTFPTPPPDDDGRARAYPAVYYPAARTSADASLITVAYGEEKRGIDFHLQAVPVRTIAGIAEGPAGPVSGLILRLEMAGDEKQGVGSEIAATSSGKDGRFVFMGVPAGRYTLESTPNLSEWTFGGQSQNLSFTTRFPWTQNFGLVRSVQAVGLGYSLFGRDGGAYWGRLNVVVGDDDVNDLTVDVHSATSLSGHVALADGPATSSLFFSLNAEPADGNVSLGLPGDIVVAPLSNNTAAAEPVGTSGNTEYAFTIEGLLAGE